MTGRPDPGPPDCRRRMLHKAVWDDGAETVRVAFTDVVVAREDGRTLLTVDTGDPVAARWFAERGGVGVWRFTFRDAYSPPARPYHLTTFVSPPMRYADQMPSAPFRGLAVFHLDFVPAEPGGRGARFEDAGGGG